MSSADAAATAVDEAIAAFAPQLPLAVAFSGGADSTAVLAACAARWPGQVRAFHVHHGLQAAADGFEAQARTLCRRLEVPIAVARVDARPAAGDSPEDAARRARYRALAAMARRGQGGDGTPVPSLVLGHHADDQVETLLLALSRGAGLPGLSAMPAVQRRDGVMLLRPLLGVPGEAVRDWLRARGLDWIEDPSNADGRYTRNRIRARLLPALAEVFPQFRATFARSAAHAAQAQALLAQLAAQDLATAGEPPRIADLRALPRERQANLLRHWLMQSHGCAPSAVQMEALLSQLAACATRGHRIHLKAGAGEVVREGDVLRWYNRRPSP